MITPKIPEYIQVSLKFSLPLKIYRQPLHCPNLTYIVSLIRKTRLKDLDFFIPSKDTSDKILKTMIFMEKIIDAIQMTKYLRSRLFEHIWRKKCLNYIIRIFTTNFTTTLKTKFLANVRLGET